ncbi:hypothetical protein SDJN02_05482, partial [Cucurbita argyrosperma subsp. argyrosperma]
MAMAPFLQSVLSRCPGVLTSERVTLVGVFPRVSPLEGILFLTPCLQKIFMALKRTPTGAILKRKVSESSGSYGE